MAAIDIRSVFVSEYAYVRRSLERLGARESEADDLCQEVFMRVHDKLASYDPSRPLRPWLFAFAVRVASNHRKLARHRSEATAEREPVSTGPDPEVALSTAQRRDLLLRALATVSVDRRAVIILHDLDGHDAPEIAASLELPLNTVYSRIREGRKDLSTAVRRLQGGRS